MNDSDLLWLTDADNTLWDTNGVYVNAQIALVDGIICATGRPLRAPDRLAWLRECDQDIAATHPNGLRYPPELLVSALLRRIYLEDSSDQYLRDGNALALGATDELVHHYLQMLKATPSLLPGVQSGLRTLHALGSRIIVVTEGAADRINTTLCHYELSSLMYSVVEARKSSSLFSEIRNAHTCSNYWAVGDQLDRDVIPAIAAGFQGIFIEGGFTPRWHPDVRHDGEYIVMANYGDAARFVASTISE